MNPITGDINLPNPDPIIISLYTHTIRDKLIRQQNDQIFHFKTSKTTVNSRRKISDRMVIITTDSGTRYDVLLYDLLFAWHGAKKFVTTDPTGAISLSITDVSDSAVDHFLRLSLIKVMYKQNTTLNSEIDFDLMDLLTLDSRFESALQIKRRILHDIYNRLYHITQVCQSEWSPNYLSNWLSWLVFGLEEQPIVLWVIEMVIIEKIVRAGRSSGGDSSCIILADWYLKWRNQESPTSPHNIAIQRGKGLVQNLCYTINILRTVLTNFPKFKLPDHMYDDIRKIYGVLRSDKVKYKGKGLVQKCDEAFFSETRTETKTGKVGPVGAKTSPAPVTAASAAAQPRDVVQQPQSRSPSSSQLLSQLSPELQKVRDYFNLNPRMAFQDIMKSSEEARSFAGNRSTINIEEEFLNRLRIEAKKGSKDVQLVETHQTKIVESAKRLLQLSEDTDKILRLIDKQINATPRPAEFGHNATLMYLTVDKLDDEIRLFNKLSNEASTIVPWSKLPKSVRLPLSGAQRRSMRRSTSSPVSKQ